MKLLDALLGRSRPAKSRLEPLFSMATAYVTMQVELNLKATGRAGVCLRPVTSARFQRAKEEVIAIITMRHAQGQSRMHFERDAHGFLWVILENSDVESLVAAMHMVSLTLEEHGLSEQLLAAVFKFRGEEGIIYWIYNYKRGAFYPFAPTPGEHQRDNATELRIYSLLEHELPMETAQERWFPLWDMPL